VLSLLADDGGSSHENDESATIPLVREELLSAPRRPFLRQAVTCLQIVDFAVGPDGPPPMESVLAVTWTWRAWAALNSASIS
jgi:hypothetical protein